MIRHIENQHVLEKYAGATEKLHLTMPDALALAHEMAWRIDRLSPRPQAVVGIANGALVPARVIADDLDLPLHILRIRYKSSRMKHLVGRSRFAARCATRLYATPPFHGFLRQLMLKLRTITRGDPPPQRGIVTGRPIVLVDDAIGTGRTILAAIAQVQEMGADHIAIATLSSYEPINKEKVYLQEPDVHISGQLLYFPWSSNNSDYPKFRQWLKDHDMQLWK